MKKIYPTVCATFTVFLLIGTTFFPVISGAITENPTTDTEELTVNCSLVNWGGNKEITTTISKEDGQKLMALLNRSMVNLKDGASENEIRQIVGEVVDELERMGLLPAGITAEDAKSHLMEDYRMITAEAQKEESPEPTGFFHSNIGSFVIGAGFGRDTYLLHVLPMLPLLPFLLPLIPLIMVLPPIITIAIIGAIYTLLSPIMLNPVLKIVMRLFLSRPKFVAPVGLWSAPRGAIATLGLLGPRFYIDLLNGVNVVLIGFIGISISLLGYAGGIVGFAPYSFIN